MSLLAPTLQAFFTDRLIAQRKASPHTIAAYRDTSADPVADLRAGWDQQVEFGLANPALYLLIVAAYRPGASSPTATAAREMLAALIHRIAEAARLRIPEHRAAQLVHAVGLGTTLTLIAMPEEERDLALSEVAREAVIAGDHDRRAQRDRPRPRRLRYRPPRSPAPD